MNSNHDSGDEHALTNLVMLHQFHHQSIFFPPTLGLDSSPSVHKQIEDLFDQAECLMVSLFKGLWHANYGS